MPTLVSESDKVERKLWTATDFLEWLKPGVYADLIDGEQFMHPPIGPKFAAGESVIRAHAIPGFWLGREWLNGEPLPEVAPCLEELLAAHS